MPKAKSSLPIKPSSPYPNYALNPTLYRILRGEQNVFKTPPYTTDLKPLWRFKNHEIAKKSAEDLWERFEGYRDRGDFVGMDVTRKFLQMGYTRSTRYAFRPSGKKYSSSTGVEIPRTGEIYDEEKRQGAQVFKDFWKRLEGDREYLEGRERWRRDVEGKKGEGKVRKLDVKKEIKVEDQVGEQEQRVKLEQDVKEEPDIKEEEDVKPNLKELSSHDIKPSRTEIKSKTETESRSYTPPALRKRKK